MKLLGNIIKLSILFLIVVFTGFALLFFTLFLSVVHIYG